MRLPVALRGLSVHAYPHLVRRESGKAPRPAVASDKSGGTAGVAKRSTEETDAFKGGTLYSERSASMGSTDAARRAGTNAAITAAIRKRAATISDTAGSIAPVS